MTVNIRVIDSGDIVAIVDATRESNVKRSDEYLRMCIKENEEKKRITLVAFVDNNFAGMVNILFKSSYPYFRSNNIPEINDLLVVPRFRKQGVGKSIIDEAESLISKSYKRIGLGVGLYKDFGAAQRLYFKNGYIPDGNGVIYNDAEVIPGSQVRVDNDLLIYLYKEL